jgi:hypothetical protein
MTELAVPETLACGMVESSPSWSRCRVYVVEEYRNFSGFEISTQ